jgi:hypothetical protein
LQQDVGMSLYFFLSFIELFLSSLENVSLLHQRIIFSPSNFLIEIEEKLLIYFLSIYLYSDDTRESETLPEGSNWQVSHCKIEMGHGIQGNSRFY